MTTQIKIKRITNIKASASQPPRFVILDTMDNIYNYQAGNYANSSVEHTFDVLAIAQEGDTLEIDFLKRQVSETPNVDRYFIQHAHFVKECVE